MTHVPQPRRSIVCGQAVVATIAGVSLTHAIAACTGGRARKTWTRDLGRGFDRLGFRLGPLVRLERLPRLDRDAVLLARVRWPWRRGGHWIAVSRAQVCDPALPAAIDHATHAGKLSATQGRIVSWAPVARR